MKGTDKFLIGLVIGIVLLVVVAFSVVLLRPKPEYRSDDSPDAVVHNYLLALRQHEYERAYECLSPELVSYPQDIEAFIEDVNDRGWLFGQNKDVALNVQSSKIVASTATVEVLETTFYSGGPLESGQDERRFDMKLHQEDGKWKLFDGDRYWNFSWNR
jgi:hypothetical protein